MNFNTLSLEPGLYLVGTPIGSARDITLRALDVLASAEVIAAEDTRSLRHLLTIHGIALNGRRVLSYHDHSGARSRDQLLEALAEGRSVAYASEAGMPLIADPGYDLVRAVIAAGHPITAAPGPTAAVTALALAGLPTDAFFFAGFLPPARAARRSRLKHLAEVPGTLVFYESPRRLRACIADMAEVLGAGREAAVCRELTKKFEEVLRARLADLPDLVAGTTLRGEIVILVDRGQEAEMDSIVLKRELTEARQTHSLKDAVDLVAGRHAISRRDVYQLALALEKGPEHGE